MKGVLLVNLGSPRSTRVSDVRRYLAEFLMDKRVIDLPWWGRFLLVYGAILPFRPKHTAEAYRQVWTAEGSPLVATSRRVQQTLQSRIQLPVELAMRYQEPSIQSALQALHTKGVTDLRVIVLFPHYAMASFESAEVRVRELAAQFFPHMRLSVLPPFYQAPGYIRALTASAADELARGYDHVLFSFHGLPERQLRKTDPTSNHCLATKNCCTTASPAHRTCYRAQCLATVRAVVAESGVPPGKFSVAYQSRLGREPWLSPDTESELKHLAAQGIERLVVLSPAFVTDCLETLEELGVRGADLFRAAGGKEFRLVPCLNESDPWLDFLECAALAADPSPNLEKAACATA